MASGMDEDRLLAEIERLLAREDPDLDARMTALARQLPDEPAARPAAPPARPARDSPRPDVPGSGDDGRGSGARHDWRKVIALVAVVIAVVGLLLTAVLTQPSGSGGDTTPVTPAGLSAPTSHGP